MNSVQLSSMVRRIVLMLLLAARRSALVLRPARAVALRGRVALFSEAKSVDWPGLRKEAARRLDRATKKVSKKSIKVASGGGEASIEALAAAERERDGLGELAAALEAGDDDAAITLAAAWDVNDAPPVRAPRGPKKVKGAAPNTGPRLPYSSYASAAGVEILVPCGWNFRPYSERAAALVASGAIGEVRHVVCHMASALTELFDGAPPRLASTCLGRSAPPPSFSHHAVLLPRGALWTE